MQEDSIRSILDRLPMVEKVGRSGNAFLAVPCLMAATRHPSGKDGHPSMTISISDGLSFVCCWSCGYKKPFVDTLFELNMIHGGLAELALEAQQIEQNRPFRLITSTKNEQIKSVVDYTEVLNELYLNSWSEKAIAFLNQKGVELKTAQMFDCAFVPAGQTIILPDGDEKDVHYDLILFPIMSKAPDGTFICVGAQGRYLDAPPTSPKYFAPFPFSSGDFFFGEQALDIRQRQPVILVEGPLDVMHVIQEGYRAVGNLGLSLQDKKAQKLLAVNPKYVMILLDPDDRGQSAVKTVERVLSKHGIQTIVRKTDKDPKYLTKSQINHLFFGKTTWDLQTK